MNHERIIDFNRADKGEIKGKKVTAFHIAVMNVVMHLELPSNISQDSIALRAGCSQQVLSTLFADFHDWEWLKIRSGKRHRNTNWIEEVLYENLPAFVPAPKLVVTALAEKMAEVYRTGFIEIFSKHVNSRGHNVKSKVPSNWRKRWSAVFQLRLNEGYTLQEIQERYDRSVNDRKMHKHLRVGPQSRRVFPKKEAK